jgi:hypothetical protein
MATNSKPVSAPAEVAIADKNSRYAAVSTMPSRYSPAKSRNPAAEWSALSPATSGWPPTPPGARDDLGLVYRAAGA